MFIPMHIRKANPEAIRTSYKQSGIVHLCEQLLSDASMEHEHDFIKSCLECIMHCTPEATHPKYYTPTEELLTSLQYMASAMPPYDIQALARMRTTISVFTSSITNAKNYRELAEAGGIYAFIRLLLTHNNTADLEDIHTVFLYFCEVNRNTMPRCLALSGTFYHIFPKRSKFTPHHAHLFAHILGCSDMRALINVVGLRSAMLWLSGRCVDSDILMYAKGFLAHSKKQ